MTSSAYSFVRHFEPTPAQPFAVDLHYLVCVSGGALRLESGGTVWTLLPARGALIAADHAVTIAVALPTVTSSVLFAPEFAPVPAAPLAVFDLTPLARSRRSIPVSSSSSARPPRSTGRAFAPRDRFRPT